MVEGQGPEEILVLGPAVYMDDWLLPEDAMWMTTPEEDDNSRKERGIDGDSWEGDILRAYNESSVAVLPMAPQPTVVSVKKY